ncbi:MAG: SDR family NAD(P)-dependent oxidoreductase, partial [Candidatus Eisenbacteria bacterium]|nr:SDR family NAD(P)-dependent oxidoreductase [Candidatus Eisenbacteria bacterium]
HPVLSGYIAEGLHARGAKGRTTASLRREEPEQATLLGSLGSLHLLGHDVNWDAVFPGPKRVVSLPTQPWSHESYWHESPELQAERLVRDPHPLLRRRIASAEPTWQTPLDVRVLDYLVDHRVDHHAVFPAAGYVEMAVAGAQRLTGRTQVSLGEVRFQRALVLHEEDHNTAIECRLDSVEGTFSIRSGNPDGENPWTLNCEGQLDIDAEVRDPESLDLETLRASLPESLSQAEIYERFGRVGLHYGPRFQGIRSVQFRESEALGKVILTDGLQEESYAMHPALLDACFQTLIAALPDSPENETLLLPVYVRRIQFFAPLGSTVHVHAQVNHLGARLLEGEIHLLDDEGRTLARLEGFQCRALDRPTSSSVEGPRDWIYEVRWENHPHANTLVTPRVPAALPPIEDLAARAGAEGAALVQELNLSESLNAAQRDLDASARATMIRFLRDLGYSLKAGDHIPAHEPGDRLGASPHHRRQLEGFFWHLEQEGFVRRGPSGSWEGMKSPPSNDPETLWRAGWSKHPAFYSDYLLQGRFAARLNEVMRGEVDPREILFPPGSTTTLATFYANSPSFRIVNRMMRAALERIRSSRPEGSILRVLEAGAGTGGLTGQLLPALDRLGTTYTFTDVSPVFLSRAEQRFGDYPFVDFRTLDLETDPHNQGFEPGSVDVLVAVDVFHATRDLRKTLQHVRRLLAPGGVLLFVEVEARSAAADLVFGLTEGWWRFEDFDLRPESALLPRDRWIELLRETGFEDLEALSLLPGETPSAQVVVLAKAGEIMAAYTPVADDTIADVTVLEASPVELATEETPADKVLVDSPQSAPVDSGLWLLFTDQPVSNNGNSRGVGASLDALLREEGAKTLLIERGEVYQAPLNDLATVPPGDPEAMDRLIQDIDSAEKIRGVVHLWSLDSAGEMSLETLRRAEVLGAHSALHMVQALDKANRIDPGMTLMTVTRGVQAPPGTSYPIAAGQAAVIGLGRVIINEYPDIQIRMVDLGGDPPAEDAAKLLRELRSDDLEEEIALRGESRFVPRCTRVRDIRRPLHRHAVEDMDFRLHASTAGAMDQLAWREVAGANLGPHEVEIEVMAAGLNFRDVLKAIALYPAEADDYLLLGDECAGRVTAVGSEVSDIEIGGAVVTMARGCFASRVVAPAAMVLPLPEGMNYEDAATLPVAFLTAHYALHEVGRLRKGESVLIQAGAGGVGMAAIQIAKRTGATVFATAGSPEKRELLKLIGVDHVLDSRSLTFADEILKLTDGRGVDVVLNSLAGRAIQKGLACLAPFGRFLELGKRDIQENSRIGMWAFRKNLSFQVIDLGSMGQERPELLGEMFRELATRFRKSEYHALPYTVFQASRVAEAFRYVAQARHIGKVVISLRDKNVQIARRDPEPMSFRADRTYLITGGLSGFGLSTAQWIAKQGGGNLVLVSRSGPATVESQEAVREIESLGANVLAVAADVTDLESMRSVLDQVRATFPPLGGVFHSAVVFDDRVIHQLDTERFSRVMNPKVSGTWILHELTLKDPLDHFVLYSSVSSWVGTPGQANYVAANACMDAFSAFRVQANLPVLVVDWGRLDEVGYVARNAEVGDILTRRGFLGFSPDQAMDGLGSMLQSERKQLGFIRLNWDVSGPALSKMRIARRVATLFGELAAEKAADDEGSRVREALRHAAPDERKTILLDYVRGRVAKVLGASAAKLDVERPLNELGFDSLMAVELKNHIDSDLAISLPTRSMMETPSITTLTDAVDGVL